MIIGPMTEIITMRYDREDAYTHTIQPLLVTATIIIIIGTSSRVAAAAADR